MILVQDSLVNGKPTMITIPCKCGWQGMVNLLVNRIKVATIVNPHHGWNYVPGDFYRVLLVREPLERWVSYFWFMKNHRSSMCGPQFDSFYKFSRMIGQYKGISAVKQPLYIYENSKPDLVVPQEMINNLWSKFLPMDWLEVYNKTAKHVTKDRMSVEDTVNQMDTAFKDNLVLEYKFLLKYGIKYSSEPTSLSYKSC